MTPFWRRLFAVELPLMGGTAIFALAAPDAFVKAAFGLPSADGGVLPLLLSYVGLIVALAWLYGRLLFASEFHRPSFRRFQECLLVGDVVLAVGWPAALAGQGALPPPALAGMGMAIVWGTIRATYLVRTRT